MNRDKERKYIVKRESREGYEIINKYPLHSEVNVEQIIRDIILSRVRNG